MKASELKLKVLKMVSEHLGFEVAGLNNPELMQNMVMALRFKGEEFALELYKKHHAQQSERLMEKQNATF